MARRTKYARRPREKDYLAWLHTQPCAVCQTRLGIEAAHTTAPGMKAMSQKGPDAEAIPLCASHHRVGGKSHHALGRAFWGYWNLDRDALIAQLRADYELSKGLAA